jgi:hypothetical protein
MLIWACTENEENRIPKKVLYMNLETTRLREREQEIDVKMK